MKSEIIKYIEDRKNTIYEVADKIWEYAELSLMEYKSCNLYCDILAREGFKVQKGICDIETAFVAEYGVSGPIIGILAEYDALNGLSQKRNATEHEEITPNGNGHGCGHNLLGAGSFGAALGIKKYLEANPDKGIVRLYGCPGEEAGASKAFMARDGLWKELDCALTWHPQDVNEVYTGSCNCTIQVQYNFAGIASHAAGAPEKGRSALDAVELMNIGVQFLREHMKDGQRVHYAITNSGGISPNVVQSNASVLYYVRSSKVEETLELLERVDKIAKGAALMTETSFEKKFIDGTADVVPNKTIEKLCYKNLIEIGIPNFTDEELAFASKIGKSYGSILNIEYTDMNQTIIPYFEGEDFKTGSTDVGDVSHLTPTIQLHIAAWPNGCPGHSWQNVSCAGSSIGHKAALQASKILAATAIDIMEDTSIIDKAKVELKERVGDKPFVSPIPTGAKPVIPD